MKTNIFYEWSFEQTDESGNIIDMRFEDRLKDFNYERRKNENIVLVRNEGNEREGLTDRYWAYVKNEKLPDYFSNSMNEFIKIKVPIRFHNELETYFKK